MFADADFDISLTSFTYLAFCHGYFDFAMILAMKNYFLFQRLVQCIL